MKTLTLLKCTYTSGGGTEYDGGDWEVVSNTDKTMTLRRVREPFFVGIDDEVLRLNKNNSGKHCLREWDDGTFTVYPYRSGIPYYFEPKP